MKYVRKTKDVWDLMSNYGYGWESEVSYNTYKEAKEDLIAYRENCPNGSFYLKKRREPINA